MKTTVGCLILQILPLDFVFLRAYKQGSIQILLFLFLIECWNAELNHATPVLTGIIQNTYSTDHLEIADTDYLTYSSTRGSGCK
jgi:hypothetical protein